MIFMTGVPPNFEQPETVPRRKKGWEPLLASQFGHSCHVLARLPCAIGSVWALLSRTDTPVKSWQAFLMLASRPGLHQLIKCWQSWNALFSGGVRHALCVRENVRQNEIFIVANTKYIVVKCDIIPHTKDFDVKCDILSNTKDILYITLWVVAAKNASVRSIYFSPANYHLQESLQYFTFTYLTQKCVVI